MDFKDYFKQLVDRVSSLKEQIQTEEATKNAFIMPFIQMLGYDVFNPTEVVPEMDCDLIKKKGDKIDYAIVLNGEPIILVECKHWSQNLSLHDNQLQKYFVASKAKFGLLTNGVLYKFFTDLDTANIMDSKPFLEIDLSNYKEAQIEELKKFHKSYFNIETILSSASELKYMSALKSVIDSEFESPSPEFVKLLTKQVYDGIVTPRVLEQFTALVKTSVANHINDNIADRLNVAIKSTGAHTPIKETPLAVAEPQSEPQSEVSKVVTTDEEKEGYFLVKSILRNIVAPERITYRDAQSYFAIMIDDNNRRIVCRLYLNSPTNKQLSITDDSKKEVKYKITALDDLYLYAEQITESAQRYI